MSPLISSHLITFRKNLCGAKLIRHISSAASLLLIIAAGHMAHALQDASMRQQAQAALRQPAKVDVIPLKQGKKPGETVPIRVLLRDGAGQPVSATSDTAIELSFTQPSGEISRTIVHLARGEKSTDQTLVLKETGITKLSVREPNEHLLGSSNYLLIEPKSAPKQAHSNKRKSKIDANHISDPRPTTRLIYTGQPSPQFTLASLSLAPSFHVLDSSATNDVHTKLQPRLTLRVSGENDAQEVRADGKASARIQVFYLFSRMPTSDIKVWLQWSNGELSPNPLVLTKDKPVAEAEWISQYPVTAAKVSVVVTDPNLAFDGPKEATIRFAAPILGIDFVNPPDSISIVDRTNLVARFFDPAGTPVQTSVKRRFRFASNSPILRLNPEQAEVSPGNSEFFTLALATSIGTCNIEVSTPGYKPVSHNVRVTGMVVLLLCLLGGVLGGVLAYIKSQGKLWARVASGVVVGLVASWAYVYIGLPKTDALILHSQLSVLFVSILAAVGGVKGLAPIAKSLGLPSF